MDEQGHSRCVRSRQRIPFPLCPETGRQRDALAETAIRRWIARRVDGDVGATSGSGLLMHPPRCPVGARLRAGQIGVPPGGVVARMRTVRRVCQCGALTQDDDGDD